mmetsp:Transcript_7024/g.9854  ORF Transcript_7024/g.9854 Transcript_7024/m.9854 type:complete len:113 (-) Transcript_7024:19-357(-)
MSDLSVETAVDAVENRKKREECWILKVAVKDKIIEVSCGEGRQQLRWLGHVGIARYDEENGQGWKELGIPVAISRANGSKLNGGAIIREVLKNGDLVVVETSLDASLTEAKL